ncbi:MAG: RsmB/NOP family class I SAM-dependent RNA methyltransferase [Silicimonas sp.]|nr:RsmB/NOP family class I SAM-dependent RNA methyltransferase [Silicimonas sp.]
MTPAARISAAIAILDAILEGAPAEKVLTNWARGNRYAGSGDRAALRDLVFGALRCKRSFAWLGGAETGRGLMLGALRARGAAPEDVFDGARFAPAPLSAEEAGAGAPLSDAPEEVRLDCPDWLWPDLQTDLGGDLAPVLELLQARAPVFLRVNRARSTREAAAAALAEDGIGTTAHGLSETALEVTENPRKVQNSRAFRQGLVELQDAASQALVDLLLPAARGARVLDYCAGGGGKALALAAGGAGAVTAHDGDPRRMKDIPARAKRAGVKIAVREAPRGPFDLVLCDVPCSGTGAWRRQPEAKWRLSGERLEALTRIQRDILADAAELVAPGGVLAYATCSLLSVENKGQISAFVGRDARWDLTQERRFSPLEGGDGFYLAILKKHACV